LIKDATGDRNARYVKMLEKAHASPDLPPIIIGEAKMLQQRATGKMYLAARCLLAPREQEGRVSCLASGVIVADDRLCTRKQWNQGGRSGLQALKERVVACEN
jgi:hypothetical protein